LHCLCCCAMVSGLHSFIDGRLKPVFSPAILISYQLLHFCCFIVPVLGHSVWLLSSDVIFKPFSVSLFTLFCLREVSI
jgi:hypothetical protein